jgi:predicted DNA-binding transcriptional regulator AlpA
LLYDLFTMSERTSTAEALVDPRTEPLLTVGELAQWLGLNPGTLRYWRHVHRGPRSLSVGGAVRYRRVDVEEWLERGAKRGSAA